MCICRADRCRQAYLDQNSNASAHGSTGTYCSMCHARARIPHMLDRIETLCPRMLGQRPQERDKDKISVFIRKQLLPRPPSATASSL